MIVYCTDHGIDKHSFGVTSMDSNSPPHCQLSIWPYLCIKEWLQDANVNPLQNYRSEGKKIDFTQYTECFINNGINFINQLLIWDHMLLIVKPFNMLIGPVKDLLGWVHTDFLASNSGYDF